MKKNNEVDNKTENPEKKSKLDYKFVFFGICFILFEIFLAVILQGCKTVDLEKTGVRADYDFPKTEELVKEEGEEKSSDPDNKDKTDEEAEHVGFTEEQKKLIPVIEPPETLYIDKSKQNKPADTGIYEGAAALRKNYKDQKVPPKYRDGKLVGWLYRENKIYEVHTQIFRTTIIKLEPGEEMVEVPYISEPDVWRISRGVGYTDGIPTQYLMVKPDYSGLTSTFIIITNKRLYQIELSSYWDHYMPICQWIYENDLRDTVSWLTFQKEQQERKAEEQKKQELEAKREYTSYDYKIKYWKKPVWCPVGAYDDGQHTYIILDEKCLNMTLPAVFNQKKEIINFNVDKNKIVINNLIEKVTLKLGKQKVTVIKKKGK